VQSSHIFQDLVHVLLVQRVLLGLTAEGATIVSDQQRVVFRHQDLVDVDAARLDELDALCGVHIVKDDLLAGTGTTQVGLLISCRLVVDLLLVDSASLQKLAYQLLLVVVQVCRGLFVNRRLQGRRYVKRSLLLRLWVHITLHVIDEKPDDVGRMAEARSVQRVVGRAVLESCAQGGKVIDD